MCDSEDSEDEYLEQQQEEGEEEEETKCLFCTQIQSSVQLTLQHCIDTHNINIESFRIQLKLDFYGWIKLINYIRKTCPSVEHVKSITRQHELFINDDYLLPILIDDPLLQIDVTSDDNNEQYTVDMSLNEKLTYTEHQLDITKSALQTALRDMEAMKKAMRLLTLNDEPVTTDSSNSAVDDKLYFNGYSHYSIHEEMIKDDIRTESYELFITRNPSIFKDKVILDIGCGTGILSLFALKAGASHVYAIDQSDIIYKAQDIAKENGYDNNVITFIKGQVETVQLPIDKVDVIISEWMGYFLLYESMLDTVLFARDKWLCNTNNVYPNKCSMSLVAMGDGYEYNYKVNYWDNVKGFKMNCIKEQILNEPHMRTLDEYSLITSSDVIKKFDVSSITVNDLEFESNFTLTVKQDSTCYGLVGYFDISFDVTQYCVHFSTGPMDTPTHWHQTVFYLKQPTSVKTGDLLQGNIKFNKNNVNPRDLDITILMKLNPLINGPHKLLIDNTYCLSQ